MQEFEPATTTQKNALENSVVELETKEVKSGWIFNLQEDENTEHPLQENKFKKMDMEKSKW